MNHLCQLDGVVDLSLVCLLHADQGDPGRLTPWVQLERHGLYLARLNVAIREPNNERRLAMDHGSFPGEQEPCSFLSAGHQGLMMVVEYQHTHDVRSFLSPCWGDPRKGLVTRLHGPVQASPLATVGLACSAPGTARHPDELLTRSGRAAD